MTIIRFLISFLVVLGILSSPAADYTPIEDREFTDGAIEVIESNNEYIKMEVTDFGFDIFNPDAEKAATVTAPLFSSMLTEASTHSLPAPAEAVSGTG